jgi:4-coumarate--CoA ligase
VVFEDADTKRSYTYAQVKDTALAFGKGLKSVWNWKKGDVLALFTPNCVDTPAITWGTLWAGGIVSPSNPTYTVEELAFQLKNSGAKAVVTQLPMLPAARAAAQKAGIPEDRVILIGEAHDPQARTKHFTTVRNLSGATYFRKTKIDSKKDLAFLVYSSGTTGLPKGVMLSHYNIVSNVSQNHRCDGKYFSWDGGVDGKGDKILAFLPFFHIYGK